jgi:hypothetical protein
MSPRTWHPLRAFGFVYFEVFNDSMGKPVGWISRASFNVPYSVFFCDGQRIVSTTRGTFRHARAVIEELAQ